MKPETKKLFDVAKSYFGNEIQASYWIATPKALLKGNIPIDYPKEAIELLENMKNRRVF